MRLFFRFILLSRYLKNLTSSDATCSFHRKGGCLGKIPGPQNYHRMEKLEMTLEVGLVNLERKKVKVESTSLYHALCRVVIFQYERAGSSKIHVKMMRTLIPTPQYNFSL